MKEPIDLLIKRREEAGVLAENPSLGARPGVMSKICGCDCLQKYAEESGAENPELLRLPHSDNSWILVNKSWNTLQGSCGITSEFTTKHFKLPR
ncbi:hypothetical protein FQN60_002464 [Etheostoma spectabile]|uniref:Uncharacterized protein n=1 Tax=Etheostoma spectabile TaxID=54343 RepID=A0A5J5CAE7_9PERO|nr:hypothetical protein FQN60_002464 [Etheostoma spectabile]